MNREMTEAAKAAKNIREILKFKFSGIKFRIRSSNFSMGDSVHVSWVDGPAEKQVNELISKYQYGHFDGMIDCYESSNVIEGLPQTKFLQVGREISEDILLDAFEFAKGYFYSYRNASGLDDILEEERNNYVRFNLRTKLSDYDLTNGFHINMLRPEYLLQVQS